MHFFLNSFEFLSVRTFLSAANFLPKPERWATSEYLAESGCKGGMERRQGERREAISRLKKGDSNESSD